MSEQGHETVLWSEKLDDKWCLSQKFDLTVSYTYRFILTEAVINALDNNVVNIHNSFLPFNRGADPNIWSVVDRTPRGVTLHYIDAQVDHGEIIVQHIVNDITDETITLKESYDNLDKAAKKMFISAFHYYPYWGEMAKSAVGVGTYHSLRDGKTVRNLISSYDMTIRDLRKALED